MTTGTTMDRVWLAAWALAALSISACTDLETHDLDSGLGIGAMGGEGGAMGGASAGTSGVTGGSTSGGSGGAAGTINSGGLGGIGAIGGVGGAGAASGTSGGIGAMGGVGGAGECPADTHACGSECVSDNSPDSCGESCEPCLRPTGGDAICDGECIPTCPEGQRPCAGVCLSETMACTGQCPDGSHDCSGVCVSNTSVNGCGTDSCSACSVPTFSEATCDGSSCDFECDGTHKKCAEECIGTAACCDPSECSGGSDCVGHQCTCPASTKTCGSGASLRCADGNCCGESDCSASATCSDSVCDCTAGQTKCGSGVAVTCWPAGSCCGDSDCSNGFACVSGSCKSFCQQQTRPGDVLASDYQCQDFDTSSTLPWPTTLLSGTAATSTSRAYSLTRSFKSSYTSNTNDDATGVMTWQAVGANEILTANVVMRVQPELLPSPQPAYAGYIDLMCLQSPTFLQCLSFTNRGTLFPSGGPAITNYTGYFVHKEISGGAFLSLDCPLTGTLNANAWNTVEYDARANGNITFNGVSAGACAGRASGTMTSLILGLREQNAAASGWAVYYDNVVVSMRR